MLKKENDQHKPTGSFERHTDVSTPRPHAPATVYPPASTKTPYNIILTIPERHADPDHNETIRVTFQSGI